MPSISGLTHVALTVRDVSVSRPWYRALIGEDPIVDEDTGEFFNVVWAFSDGTVFGLHQHSRPAPDEQFDELRVGLDHVSFGVENRTELEKWMNRLDELHIPHGGIKDAPYGSGLSFRDPDGIALEFFAPPSGAAM